MIDILNFKEFFKNTKLKQDDTMYNLSNAQKEMQEMLDKKPYKNDPKYFKKVKISLMSLIKMLNHAQMGGNVEVMGVFQGFFTKKGQFYVMDSLALPVEANETRVNAGAEADNFVVDHAELSEKLGSFNNIGWYHSHPTYGCWLSGIDVNTQLNYQKINDPWLAIVIDPIRTITRGNNIYYLEKIEIGAFRTFPSNYDTSKQSNELNSDIPMKKIADFGVHYNKYYPLEVEFFQNQMDINIIQNLWKKYWVGNLANSPFYKNVDYFTENIEQVKLCAQQLCKKQHLSVLNDQTTKKKQTNLKKIINLTLEKNQAILGETVKNLLF